MPGTAERAESQAVDDAGDTPAGRRRENAAMEIEQLEKIAAVIVTAGLVAGNFLMFTPWRNGEDPRQQNPRSMIQMRTEQHLMGREPDQVDGVD